MLASTLFLTALAPLGFQSEVSSPAVSSPAVSTQAAGARITPATLPLRFEENLGQLPGEVRFTARRGGLEVFFTDDGFVAKFGRLVGGAERTPVERAFDPGPPRGAHLVGAALRFRFEGLAPGARPIAGAPRPGITNYLRGNDRAAWTRGVRSFESLAYAAPAGGARVLFRDDGGILTYDFEVPEGEPETSLGFTVEGADSLVVDDDGALRIRTSTGELIHTAPQAREIAADGAARPLASRFRIVGKSSVAFEVAGRHPARKLVIDPGILYSSYFGGNFAEAAQDVTLDAGGNVYITGYTDSVNFPTVLGSFDVSSNGDFDVFVVKLKPDGSALEYGTFLGGEDLDQGIGIAVDATGAAYVVGDTMSFFFPVTPLSYAPVYHGGFTNGDAFLVKLTPDGTDLMVGTFLGGVSDEVALRVVLDANNNVYIAGWTRSPDFITPQTALSAYDNTYNGATVDLGDAFVLKLDGTGSSLIYATLLGGPEGDAASGIALDSLGRILVTGIARSKFPVKAGAFPTYMGNTDGFIAMINPFLPGDASLVFCDLIGGTNYDYGYRVAVDSVDAIYLLGYTTSDDFPKVAGSFDTIYNKLGDLFVLKIDKFGVQLGYSTYIGGGLVDTPTALAVDPGGTAYVGGNTKSFNIPTTSGSFDPKADGGQDGLLVKVSPNGTKLLTCTYFGGISDDAVASIAIAGPDVVWVAGSTFSKNFPIVGPALKKSIYLLDSFVTKVDLGAVPIVCLDSSSVVAVSCDAGTPPFLGATKIVSNCGSPDSQVLWHMAEATDAPWLAESTTSGGLVQGQSAPVDLTFDSTGLVDGAYTTTLHFENDGDANNHFDVPVLFTVQQPIVMPFVPLDTLSGAVDFAGEWDSGSFSAVKGMWLKLGIASSGGDLAPIISLLDANDQLVKSYTLKHSEKVAKRTFVIKADGNYRIVVSGVGFTSGTYAITTEPKFPADAKPYTKKNQHGKIGGVPLLYKTRLLAGATLSATFEPATVITGPLGVELLDPTLVPIDVSGFTQPFGNGGLQLVGVPVSVAGQYTLRVSGLAFPKEKINISVTPAQPVGGAAVNLP